MPHSRTLPTPSYPSPKNSTTFYGAATIAAPISAIWSILSDLDSYPQWSNQYQSLHPSKAPQTPSVGRPTPFTHVFPTPLHDPSSPSLPSKEQKSIPQHRPKPRTHRTPSLLLTLLSPEAHTVAWKYIPSSSSLPGSWAFHAEQEIHAEDFGDGNSEVRSFITAGGALKRLLFWWWGWNGHGAAEGGMDEAMRRFAEDVGAEVARRLVVREEEENTQHAGRRERREEDGIGDEGRSIEEEERIREVERKIVNPERKVRQPWVTADDDNDDNDIQWDKGGLGCG